MKNTKAHSSLLGLVGGYLLYLAWNLYDSMAKEESNMAPWFNILSIIFFVLAGIGVVIYAWWDWDRVNKKEAAGESEEAEKNGGLKKE